MSSSTIRNPFTSYSMSTPLRDGPLQQSSMSSLNASTSCNASSGEPTMVRLTKAEHDVLIELARRYTNLRSNLITLGADLDVIERFSHESSISPTEELVGDPAPFPSRSTVATDYPSGREAKNAVSDATLPANPVSAPRKPMSARADVFCPSGLQTRVSKWIDDEAEDTRKNADSSVNDESNIALTPSNADLSAEELTRVTVARYARRSVRLDNLTVGTRLSDIEAAVRGGPILEIYQRHKEKAAIVSFVHEHDAQTFYEHARRYDLYVKAKRIEVSWNDFQKSISGQLVWSIRNGATRNLIVRQCDQYQTEEGIRDDLEHIHDLRVISVAFQGQDCYIRTNSISGAVFARSCMSSRHRYRRCRMEWDIDECSEPLIDMPNKSRHSASSPPFKLAKPINRFEMLSVDRDA